MFERSATTTGTLLPFPYFHVERYVSYTGGIRSAIEGYCDPTEGRKGAFQAPTAAARAIDVDEAKIKPSRPVVRPTPMLHHRLFFVFCRDVDAH